MENVEPEVWSELPADLTLAVLARLPLKDLARYRSVCKRWRAIWHCPTFLQMRSRVADQEEPWYIFNHGEWAMGDVNLQFLCYNAGMNKWHFLDFNNHVPYKIDRVAASAGGLVLFVGRPEVRRRRISVVFWNWPEMIVCNPLKENCWTRLPRRSCFWKPHTIGMIVDAKAQTFKVVMATFNQGTEIYDSTEKVWRILSDCRFPGKSFGEATCHKGLLLCVGEHEVFAFDAVSESWTAFDLPNEGIPQLRVGLLYSCNRRLLLLGLSSGKMHVWERVGEDVMTGVWLELSAVSTEDVTSSFCSEETHEFGNAGRGKNVLFFRVPENWRALESEESTARAYVYVLSQNSWYVVGKNSASNLFQRYMGNGLRFEPKIEACV